LAKDEQMDFIRAWTGVGVKLRRLSQGSRASSCGVWHPYRWQRAKCEGLKDSMRLRPQQTVRAVLACGGLQKPRWRCWRTWYLLVTPVR